LHIELSDDYFLFFIRYPAEFIDNIMIFSSMTVISCWSEGDWPVFFFVQAESKSSPVWLPIILGQTGLFLQQSNLGYHQSFLKTRGIEDAQVD
jgi:hypothetical protein